MSEPTPTARSKPKPSPADEIVELRPPPEIGSSATLKLYRQGNEAMIDELIRRRYSVVSRKDDAA